MLTEFEWKAIISGIESEQCIICLGSELFSLQSSEIEEKNTNSLVERLSEFLTQHQEELEIKVQDNAWFHLMPGGSDGPAYQAIKSYYGNINTLESQELLLKIARIKFHLFLSLTPDYHLLNGFEEQGLSYKFDSYTRNQPDRRAHNPTKDKPLVYNILGELNRRNSLVLTYDDFYDYLESVIKGNSMSQLIKDNILDAQYFLFIGIPFDQWFVHLFMRIIRQHKERKTKFATSGKTSKTNLEISKEQYHIKFINSGIKGFVDELFRRCEAENLIKDINERANKVEKAALKINNFKHCVEKNDFEKLVQKLKENLRGVGERGKPLLLQVLQLSARHQTLNEKRKLGVIKMDDELLAVNKLRKDFLDLISTFEMQLADL